MNGCLNLHAFNSAVGKSVQVVPVSKKHDAPTTGGFETDYLYNLPTQDEEHIKVPIAHGLFRTVDKSNHTSDGAYVDEAFDMFLAADPEAVSSIQSLWAMPIEEDMVVDAVNTTSADFLEARQLEWGYCNFQAMCLGAVSLSIKIRNSETGKAVEAALRDHPWTVIAQGVDFVISRAANGITILGTVTGSGSGSPDICESQKTTGRLVNDLVSSSKADGLTNGLWQVVDEDGGVWEVALKLKEDGKANTNNCGACPTCM